MIVTILEIVLREVNNCEFITLRVYELIDFVFVSFIFIIFSCFPEENDVDNISKVLCLVVAFLPGILICVFDDTSSHLEGFMKSFMKFKIISIFVSIGNDIIFGIIFGCVKMKCHFILFY